MDRAPNWSSLLLILGALVFIPAAAAAASNASPPRTAFPNAIREIPVGAPLSVPHRTRSVLTPAETAQTIDLVINLPLRGQTAFLARVQAGQRISFAEMAQTYLPRPADLNRVAAWLTAQGLAVAPFNAGAANLYAKGTIAQVAAAFGVSFARVATSDGEFTSAVTAPSLPAEIAGLVANIDGLQPHIRMHSPRSTHAQVVNSVNGSITPADLAAAYSIPSTLTGAGQTIAIIMDAAPSTTDLAAFWTACGIADSTSSVSSFTAGTGTTGTDAAELDLDLQWASSIAPGAKIQVYSLPALTLVNLTAAVDKILTAAASDATISVVSYSAAGPESLFSTGSMMSTSVQLARLAAAGITFLGSSGDGGSNPNPAGGGQGYSSTYPLAVEYPASDVNATGVGGTLVTFNSSWATTSEVVWAPVSGFEYGTGGGASSTFSHPSWQTGAGVPGSTHRYVPDVSAIAEANTASYLGTGAYIVVNGSGTSVVGTSLACPVWAGMVALLNQSRASKGLGPLGLLGPWIYPLIGTSAFQDITSGSNGAYSAGPGYDVCSGVGSPNITNLAAVLVATKAGGPYHSADYNQDYLISLAELSRVIELYNTHDGTTRTGAYLVQAGTEDGFAPDPTRAAGVGVTLSKYHSADQAQNGTISLADLSRVIELYNYHSGTTRTGQYHAQAGTEDGFAPGP